jgi:UDP-N-acetylmuramoyl-L-alanyl-D-glutamate--2,6-diaminopimelate ligase
VLTGVTGTNGKTTTTYLLKSILESQGKHVGLIGTIQYMIEDRVFPARHTTPESVEFQALLKDMFTQGCTHVVSEVSSHALAQHRVDNTVFRAAVFTNLTRDHLDFHKTMEDYFRAKKKLFTELLHNEGTAVINTDDPYGKRLDSQLRMLRPELNILTYGREPGADITARDIEVSFRGLRFDIAFRGERYGISSPLTGIPNVYNILSAAGAAIALRVPWQEILEGIRRTGTVSGRFERIDAGQNFLCIIDYAHTEDALERLIQTARELIKKSAGNRQRPEGKQIRSRPPSPEGKRGGLSHRVITVFGCGGDRDRGKRPKMGEVATRLSDFVILTSDNPRFENPSAIIKDIENGAVRKNYLIEPDRREAIRRAAEMAGEGDIVLVAGKGHEDYQEMQGGRKPFSDRGAFQAVIEDIRRRRDVQ